jgi:hypothetical protein
LIEQGESRRVVQAVNFGGKPVEPPPLDERGNPAGGPANRRAEMWSNLKKALEEGRVSLPDSDSLQADITSAGYKYNSAGQLLIDGTNAHNDPDGSAEWQIPERSGECVFHRRKQSRRSH